jgi:hypothetical protein
MPATIGVVQTGTYLITNAKNKNNAVLPDANNGTPIVARSDDSAGGSKWNVTLLNNGKYNLTNYQFATSATTMAGATAGDDILARPRVQQWVIKETATRGNYLISPIGGEYFWGLADDDEETPLTLAAVPNNKINQWNFTRILI